MSETARFVPVLTVLCSARSIPRQRWRAPRSVIREVWRVPPGGGQGGGGSRRSFRVHFLWHRRHAGEHAFRPPADFVLRGVPVWTPRPSERVMGPLTSDPIASHWNASLPVSTEIAVGKGGALCKGGHWPC